MRRLLAAGLLTLALALPAAAQDGAAAPTPGQLQAARTLLTEMGQESAIDAGIETMLRIQLEGNPNLRPYEAVMRGFLSKYMGWAAIREPMAEIYAAAFSERELEEMAAFYRTPTGRKAARLAPQLMQQAAALGQRQVSEHTDELREAVRREMERSNPR